MDAAIGIDLKVNLALIVSALALVSNWYQAASKRRDDRLAAYERLYGDAVFLRRYPFEKREKEAAAREYTNQDPQLETAVRGYLGSNWMVQGWGRAAFVPDDIRGTNEGAAFLGRMISEAREFSASGDAGRFVVPVPEFSPVWHMDDREVARRMSRIFAEIEKTPSRFSDRVHALWLQGQRADPASIRALYQRGLDACDAYFDHNPRDFADPFVEICDAITKDYQELKTGRLGRVKSRLWLVRWRLTRPFAGVFRRRRPPSRSRVRSRKRRDGSADTSTSGRRRASSDESAAT